MMYSFRESFKAQLQRAIGDFGFAGWILLAIVGVVLLILAVAIIIMCLARRKQRKIDDRRTAMDLLERGRLTPVRSKPLPPTPQSRRNDSATGSVGSDESRKLAMDLSPHPFQQPEEEIGQGSAPISTATFASITTRISERTEQQRQESPPSIKEPTPKTMSSKENLQAMTKIAMSESQSELEALNDSRTARDLHSPGSASGELPKAPNSLTNTKDGLEPNHEPEELNLIHSAPRNMRTDPKLYVPSSSKKKEPPRRFIGP